MSSLLKLANSFIEGINKIVGWKNYRDRLAILLLLACFGIVISDSRGLIDVTKWGYAAIGGYITTVITFYFRKKGPSDGSLGNGS